MIKNKEILGGIIFFSLSLYLFYETSNFSSTTERYRSLGPAVFPYVLAICLGLLSIVLFIQGVRSPKAELFSFSMKTKASVQVLSLIAMLFVFLIWVEKIGFIIWSLSFMFLGQIILGERRLVTAMVLSIAVVGIIYLIFGFLLNVPLSSGFLSY